MRPYPERNIVPVTTVKEGGIINGGDLPAFDEAEFNTVHKKYRVITRAFADLCNPAGDSTKQYRA